MSNNAQTRTATLIQKIAELERDVEDMIEVRSRLRIELDTATIGGADTGKVRETLDAQERRITQSVEQLGRLDKQLVAVSAGENVLRRAELKKQAEAKYRKARAELERSLKPLAQTARAMLPNAEAVIRSTREAIVRSVWGAINSEFSDRYVAFVPALVRTAPERNSDGQRVDLSTGTLHQRR